jgi:hypothetical protein
MSSMDMGDEADLAAMALVRLAVEHRQVAGGSVREAITPYLEKCWQEAGAPEDGFNAAPALSMLLAHLSQFAAAAFQSYVQCKSGEQLPPEPQLTEQLLDRLAGFELRILAEARQARGEGS